MQTLLIAAVEDGATPGCDRVLDFVRDLVTSRKWLGVPPRFEHNVDWSSCTEDADLPITTLGLSYQLDSGASRGDADVMRLQELHLLIDGVRAFSEQTGSEWEAELDGVYAGTIADGKLDDSIKQGLLGVKLRVGSI